MGGGWRGALVAAVARLLLAAVGFAGAVLALCLLPPGGEKEMNGRAALAVFLSMMAAGVPWRELADDALFAAVHAARHCVTWPPAEHCGLFAVAWPAGARFSLCLPP